MKNLGILMMSGVIALSAFGSLAVPTASADCSENGYYHSGGKCGKSYDEGKHKKEKKEKHEWKREWQFPMYGGWYWNAGSSYQSDRIAELLRLIEELRRELRQGGGNGTSADVRVTTKTATDIDEDSATLRGTLDIQDGNDAEVWFEYGTDRFDLNDETSKETVDENDDSDVSESISGLDDNTTYFFRMVGKGEDGRTVYGALYSFRTADDSSNNDEDPVATTDAADDIDSDSARLRGQVDMNDFENGVAFFVVGEDKGQIDDVDDDFDTYSDVDEDGDDLRKVLADSDADSDDSYTETVNSLDDNTTHYVRMCVEYEDEDGDDTLICGGTRSFTTD